MLLTDNDIKNLQLVQNEITDNYGATSYDLSTDIIIDADGNKYEGSGYTIKPQEIVWVISKERIVLPKTVTAHAIIKTGLCNRGLLALNIGIVDPEWDGPLSTAIINFSKQGYRLTNHERFLRLSFFEHTPPGKTKECKFTREAYVNDKVKLAAESFRNTFLDVKGLVEDVKEQLFDSWKQKIVFNIASLGFLIASLSFFVAVASYLLPWQGNTYQKNQSSLQEHILQLNSEIDALSGQNLIDQKTYEKRMDDLQKRLDAVETQLNSEKPKQKK